MADAWVKLYNEILRAQEHYKSGKATVEESSMNLKFFKRREQILKQAVGIRQIGYPNGGRPFLNSLTRGQLYDEYEAIKLLPMEIGNENVFCSVKNHEITRSECLDYSGEAEHYENDCKGCEAGIANKKLLCPPQTRI